jgi:hypothetical protein
VDRLEIAFGDVVRKPQEKLAAGSALNSKPATIRASLSDLGTGWLEWEDSTSLLCVGSSSIYRSWPLSAAVRVTILLRNDWLSSLIGALL